MNNKTKQIKEIDEKLKELDRRKKELALLLETKEKNTYRKKRARRLIETGALAEKYFKIAELPLEKREEFFRVFSDFIVHNKPDKFKTNS